MKIGYALGGGAARGLSHIGVLKVLEENGIYPDFIAGTSIGAIVGALYAGGYKAADIEQLALGLDWKKIVSLADFALPAGGFIKGHKVTALLKSILGDLTFSQLKCPYACTTTDVITGEEVILTGGSLIDAIRASISIPGVFKPVPVDGRYLIDGGLLNEVPVNVCRLMGADYVIGVNVIPAPNRVKSKPGRSRPVTECVIAGNKTVSNEAGRPELNVGSRLAGMEKAIKAFLEAHHPKVRRSETMVSELCLVPRHASARLKPPTLWETLRQSLAITQYYVAIQNLKSADIAISPEIEGIGFWQFTHAAAAIQAGEEAAREVLRQSDLSKMTRKHSISGSQLRMYDELKDIKV